MKYTIATIGVLFVAGCTVQKPPHLPPPMVEAQAVLPEPLPPPIKPPAITELLDELPPDVISALDKYTATGKAPLIKGTGFVIFPYGLSQPEVRCRPDSICDIELEPGEEVLDLAAADTVRWQFQPLREGPKEKRTTHITVKPQDTLPMETGIVVGTDRRVYRIKIKSSPNAHIVNAKFYYPVDLVTRFNEAQSAQQKEQAHVVAELPSVSVTDLDYDYHIEGRTSFTPTMAMNDGARTYLKMADGVEVSGSPILLVEKDGKSELVNYTPQQTKQGVFYLVHGVPQRLLLRSGVGRNAEEVTIVRGRR